MDTGFLLSTPDAANREVRGHPLAGLRGNLAANLIGNILYTMPGYD